MIQQPLAILRFMWNDQANVTPKWGTDAYTAIFMKSRFWWSVANYWEDCSYGLISLQGNELFDWRVHDFNFLVPKDGGGMTQNDRRLIIQSAVDKVLQEGISLDGFAGVLVVFPESTAGSADFGASGGINIGGRSVSGALLNEGLWHTLIAHEVGHVLGFDHSYGREPDPTVYKDHYCIMSAANWQGYRPWFTMAADPAVPSVGSLFFNVMGPAPTCALLYRYLDEFRNTPLVDTLPANFRQSAPRMRLYAADMGWNRGPVLVVAPTEPATRPFEKCFLIEYRRAAGWDRALQPNQDIDNTRFSDPGIIIHSISDHVEPTVVDEQYVVLEGFIPIPLRGDADFSLSGGRDFSVVVNGIADDGSYVDVTLGRADLTRDKAVVASIPEWQGGDSELAEEGVADKIFIPPNCGTGRFSYRITRQESVFKLSARAYGYRLPAFTWKVNGVALPAAAAGRPARRGTIAVPVNATFPRPSEVISRNLMAKIGFELLDNTLTLKTRSLDGNFDLWINLTASETDQGVIATAADDRFANGNLRAEGIFLSYGEDWQEAVRNCWARYLSSLPSAGIFRGAARSDISRAALFGSRTDEHGGFDGHDQLAAEALVKEVSKELPALGIQLQTTVNAMKVVQKGRRFNNG